MVIGEQLCPRRPINPRRYHARAKIYRSLSLGIVTNAWTKQQVNEIVWYAGRELVKT